MIESFQTDSIYWILGTTLIALVLTIFGALTSSGLPSAERKMRVRKFGLIGIAIVFFCLPIFKPFVSSYSSVEYLDEPGTEKLTSIEALAKFEKEQTRTIEKLKREVVELKEDTYRMNLYYSSVVQFLSTIIAILSLSFALRKEEKNTSGS